MWIDFSVSPPPNLISTYFFWVEGGEYMKVNCRTNTQSDVCTAVKSNTSSYSYGVPKTCLSSLITGRIYAERQKEYTIAIRIPEVTASL
jgi:hypothetical protein